MELVVLKGPKPGRSFPLEPGQNVAGRSEANPIRLGSAHVSGRHCAFTVEAGRVVVRDLGSTNGIYVEGRKVGEATLQHGMRVQVGDWLLALRAPELVERPPPTGRPTTPDADRQPPESTHPGEQGASEAVGFPGPAVPDRSVTRPSGAPPAAGGTSEPEPGGVGFGFSEPSSSEDDGGFGQPEPAVSSDLLGPAHLGSSRDENPETSAMFGAEEGAPPPPPPVGPEPAAEPSASQTGAVSQESGFGEPSSSGGFGEPAESSTGFGAFGASEEDLPSSGGGFGISGQGFGDRDSEEPGAFGVDVDEEDELEQAAPREMNVARGEDWLSNLKYLWARTRRFPWKLQLVAIFVAVAFVLFIGPYGGVVSHLLRARNIAEDQALERGKALALALASRNVEKVARQNNLELDAGFILAEPGVKMAMITNEQGVVRAPPEKVRQSIGNKDYFSEANTIGRTVVWEKGGGEWHILAPIRVAVVDGAPSSIAAWAYLLYDVGSVTGASAPVLGRLVGSAVVIFVALGMAGTAIWRLVTVPVMALREETELSLRGHQTKVRAPAEWDHLRDLAHSINRVLLRWRKAETALQAGGDQRHAPKGGGLGPEALCSLVEPLPNPVFVVSAHPGAQPEVLGASRAAAAWLQQPPEALRGRRIADLLPDPAFVDTLNQVCARLASGKEPAFSSSAQVGDNPAHIRATRSGSAAPVVIVSVG